jgi:Protein of unknown function (DUF3592)
MGSGANGWNEVRRAWVAPPELPASGPRQTRLRAQGKMMVFLAMLMFGGAIALYVSTSRLAARDAAARAALDASGIETQGAVTRRWTTGDKNHTPKLAYEFECQGREYHGSSSAPRREWEALAVGSPIAIRFVPDRPELNHPGGWAMDVLPAWVAPGTAAGLCIPGLILLFMIRKQTSLLRDGTAVPARVTGHRRMKGGQMLVYEFRLPDGSVIKGRGGQTRKPPQIGSTVTVLYDPDQPKRNAPYPLDTVRLDR